MRKRPKARTGVKAHGRAPTTQLDQAGQQCGTAWPCWVARPCHMARRCHWWCGRGYVFRNFFVFRAIFHSAFFLAFSSCFRVLERGLRESQNVDLGFEFMLLDWRFIKIQQLFNFQHQFIQVCSSSFSSLILVLGFCVFFNGYQFKC